jgi:hypothetical protein
VTRMVPQRWKAGRSFPRFCRGDWHIIIKGVAMQDFHLAFFGSPCKTSQPRRPRWSGTRSKADWSNILGLIMPAIAVCLANHLKLKRKYQSTSTCVYA